MNANATTTMAAWYWDGDGCAAKGDLVEKRPALIAFTEPEKETSFVLGAIWANLPFPSTDSAKLGAAGNSDLCDASTAIQYATTIVKC